MPSSIYDFGFTDTHGQLHSMADYQGKVLLLVNTATQCGFASQFEGLEMLHKKYSAKGLVVIGFPSSQFLNQEPVSDEDMVEMCKLNHGVTFLLSQKILVNGVDAHPLFKFLQRMSRGWFGRRIKWNFTKFLIGREGLLIKRFSPFSSPEKIDHYLEKNIF